MATLPHIAVAQTGNSLAISYPMMALSMGLDFTSVRPLHLALFTDFTKILCYSHLIARSCSHPELGNLDKNLQDFTKQGYVTVRWIILGCIFTFCKSFFNHGFYPLRRLLLQQGCLVNSHQAMAGCFELNSISLNAS